MEKPTSKQIELAKKLNIENPDVFTKAQLSTMISEAIEKNRTEKIEQKQEEKASVDKVLNMSDRKDVQIARAVALKAAVELVANEKHIHLTNVLEISEELEKWLTR